MTIPWIRLAGWGLVIAGIAVFANSPQEYMLGSFWRAGFPFVFAAGMGQATDTWRVEALWGNIAVWAGAYLLVAALVTVSYQSAAPVSGDKAG